ncbi:MAG: hypothetical protein IJV58_04865 [Oscillospiraceae bacterium]|nr:hypothetical protein [Oscillospiraceae bacterium]
MNTIGKHMNIAMGVALSFCLSLVGNLTSGHFTAGAFIASFLLSTDVSLIIGFCVPLRKITESACKHMQPGTFKRRCAESLISDLAYTPVMTLLMILLAWFGAARHGGSMPFVPALVKAEIISLIVGFVLIFIFQPLFLRQILKENGIGAPPQGQPPEQPESKED